MVKPVEEGPSGEGAVRARIRTLVDFVRRLNAKKNDGQVRNADLPNLFSRGTDSFVIYPDGNDIAAIPQVTSGIRIGRIRKLFRVLSDPNSEAAKRIFGADDQSIRAYSRKMEKVSMRHSDIKDSNWADHRPSAKLCGLVTYLAFYIQQGIDQQGVDQLAPLTIELDHRWRGRQARTPPGPNSLAGRPC